MIKWMYVTGTEACIRVLEGIRKKTTSQSVHEFLLPGRVQEGATIVDK